jgi:folate-binding protein YgfZ
VGPAGLYLGPRALANKPVRAYLYPAMANAHFALLEDRGVLAVSGPDRRPFLQGLVSNDVDKLGPRQARYAALLTAQGRYLHDFMMIEVDGAILLDAEAARLADLQRRLSIYRLRAKAVLSGRPELCVAAIFGEAARTVVDLPAEPGSALPFAGGVVFVDPRLAALGARSILPRAAARASLLAAGLYEVDFAAYDRLRLGLGVPDGSRDMAPEKSILLEAGFDELNGIDWDKGCYVGQELTARTRYRGLVRRRLMPVAIDGPIPAPGAIVSADGREVGEMRSGSAGLGLALLRIEPPLEGVRLSAGEATVVPQRPAWMRLRPATD